MASEKVTISEVRSEFIASTDLPDGSQALKNHLTVLNRFLEYSGAGPEDNAVPLLLPQRGSVTARFSDYLGDELGLAESTVGPMVSRLRPFIAACQDLLRARIAKSESCSVFNIRLMELIGQSGQSQRSISKLTDVSRGNLREWTVKARQPKAESYAQVERLEAFFGLEPGDLIDLIDHEEAAPVNHREEFKSRGLRPRQTEFNQVVVPALKSSGELDSYRLSPLGSLGMESNADVCVDWLRVVDFKTSKVVKRGLKRSANWKCVDPVENQSVAKQWFSYNSKGMVSPTASISMAAVDRFAGYVTRPSRPPSALTECVFSSADSESHWRMKLVGAGHCRVSEFRLHMIADLDLLEGYVEYLADTSEGAHSGATVSLGALRDLLSDSQLLRQDSYFSDLAGCTREEWGDAVTAAYDYIQDAIKQLNQSSEKRYSRDPRKPLERILSSSNMLSVLDLLEARIEADAPAKGNTVSYAVWARDRFLVRFMNSNPLRVNTLANITFLGEASGASDGMLSKSDDGDWELLIPKRYFKNLRGAKKEDYYCRLPSDVSSALEDYLSCRHLLRGGSTSPYLFRPMEIGHSAAEDAGDPDRPMTTHSIAAVWVKTTRKYLPEYTVGYSIHGQRHVVASALLQANPDAFVTVAEVLHDDPKTVIDNYAHPSPSNGVRRWAEIRKNARASSMQEAA